MSNFVYVEATSVSIMWTCVCKQVHIEDGMLVDIEGGCQGGHTLYQYCYCEATKAVAY